MLKAFEADVEIGLGNHLGQHASGKSLRRVRCIAVNSGSIESLRVCKGIDRHSIRGVFEDDGKATYIVSTRRI